MGIEQIVAAKNIRFISFGGCPAEEVTKVDTRLTGTPTLSFHTPNGRYDMVISDFCEPVRTPARTAGYVYAVDGKIEHVTLYW